MIYINFTVTNPWSNLYRMVRSWSGVIGADHAWEVQISRTPDVIDLGVWITPNQDHAGVRVTLGVLSWHVEVNVYNQHHFAPL